MARSLTLSFWFKRAGKSTNKDRYTGALSETQASSDDQEADLSVRLCQILDCVGVSEHTRQFFLDYALVREIPENLGHRIRNTYRTVYLFGSCCEGTTTPGLLSDTDVLQCAENLPVIESVREAPSRGTVLVMVRDTSTKPGYVKLQVVTDGVSQSVSRRRLYPFEAVDHRRRICFKHASVTDDGTNPFAQERNGPADTYLGGQVMIASDFVFALRCNKIPSFAREWIYRRRKFGWPSVTQMDTVTKFGCFLVGVGHPRSVNKALEWRISFSLQERELMLGLNPIQHKCYVLLKMIKKSIIEREIGKTISSYHCKTCLFDVIETQPDHIWQRENLLLCVQLCLKVLLKWTKSENCPNFFIRSENMFDRLETRQIKQVRTVLEEVLSAGFNFIWLLQCDEVGELLHMNLCHWSSEIFTTACTRTLASIKFEANINFSLAMNVVHQRNLLLYEINSSRDRKEWLKKSILLLNFISSSRVRCISEHTVRDVKFALSFIKPHIHLHVTQILASILTAELHPKVRQDIWKLIKHHLVQSQECDLVSARLIAATILYRLDILDACAKILASVEESLELHVMSVCWCHIRQTYKRNALYSRLASTRMSAAEYRQTCTTSCMVFLSYQSDIVHPALRYELFRSLYTPPGSRDEKEYYWFDWIVVDAEVYLFFLQYLLFSKRNQFDSKHLSLNRLVRVISGNPNLGHVETAYNLLGWIFKQENMMLESLRCFVESWRIRPIHNAAKWHVALLFYLLYGRKEGNTDMCLVRVRDTNSGVNKTRDCHGH